MHMMQAFLIAVQFLTIVPVRVQSYTDKAVGQSILFYPLVGLIIGILISATAYFLSTFLSDFLTAAIILVVWVGLTGGLHLDGLADSADAWMGGLGSRSKTLEIMKDTHVGSFAVVCLILVLLLKFVLISEFINSAYYQYLILPPILGRCAIVVLFLTTKYVREQGLARIILNEFSSGYAIVVLLSCFLFGLLLAGPLFLAMIFFSLLFLTLLRHCMLKRLDGFTGDTIGASVEFIELVALLSLVVASS